ncbi:YafY family transcriptional regulator [Microbacterium sp. zg.Y1090]|uniref:helix-turn-helix transcriptional regulator n=1 Tax=Microbacterium TaxID=33882 RepID=UPI00214C3C4F|nr:MULTISPECIES: YafY family protein [unclassified Microbacterium]MCR2812445.1 YafY family transcriptional regulator [Microbacterium sp. zg.Y1084]MCR2817754.1 YafY family transcriptional regulator [Microbacterium sp. zg.Y1090]MDL5485602.1 YafY family protein [Microbacterium sp. zg-Y1211]WIM28773.1 YafY family protein [Microbacterium sp. zg-Y1090]
MSDTTSRALTLLNLLQTHRHWPGSELAQRLGVTERTVRRDVERLRELGYRIESSPGAAGGYRLEAGSAVPPLLLNDDEAVAMAIGLRIAATQRLIGGAETALTALAKLEQVLPAALRRRVMALADTVHPVRVGGGEAASTAVLGELALACRDSERVRFSYTSAAGEMTRRRVEPHYLAPADRHWYLLCWDLERDDWRTFRVDRLSDVEHTRVLFEPRPLTPEEVDEFITVARSWVRQPVETDVVMDLPLDTMRASFGQWGQGATAEDADRTRWPVGGADWRETMYGMSWIPDGVPFTTDLAEPHRAEMREALVRMLAALDAPPPPRA